MDHTAGNTEQAVHADLADSAIHALKWRYAGAILEAGLRFGIGVVLVRLLSPEAFGIASMVWLVIGFGKLLGDLGFGVSIIQYPCVTQNHVRAAITGSVIMGLLLFAGLWLMAPVFSHVFRQDALTPMLRFVGVSFVLSGMSAAPAALLRRELRFRVLAVIETSSYVVGYGGVGLPLAFFGYGAWSLIIANTVQMLCLVTLVVYVTRPPVWPYFQVREYRQLIHVASAEVLNNVTNYLADYLHIFVIGKWHGALVLGLYNRSFSLLDLPVRNFSAVVYYVMFPVFAQIQGDTTRLGSAFLRTVSLTGVFVVPVFLVMAVAPETVIGGLYGGQWKTAARVLQILSLGGMFMGFLYVFGALSHARGYVYSEWKRQVIYLGLMGAALWFFLPHGIEGVALAVVLAACVRYLLLAHLSLQLVGISWQKFMLALMPGGLLGITVATAVAVTSMVSNIFVVSDVLRLLAIMAVAVLSWTASFLLLPSSWLGDLPLWVNKRFGAHLPYWLRKIMTVKYRTLSCCVSDAHPEKNAWP